MENKKFTELEKRISNTENIYKNFREGIDYTISFDRWGKKIYNIHSEELANQVFGGFREGLISNALLGTGNFNNSSFEQNLSRIKNELGDTIERGKFSNSPKILGEKKEKSSSFLTTNLKPLQEELCYLRSLPDESGYLRNRIKELERKIAREKNKSQTPQENFSQQSSSNHNSALKRSGNYYQGYGYGWLVIIIPTILKLFLL